MAENLGPSDQPGGRRRVAEQAHALHDRAARVESRLVQRYRGSVAATYWGHLTAVDFMTSSFAFAALAVISAFPFLAVVAAMMGQDIKNTIVARMGLSAEAARYVDRLIASGGKAVASLTVFSAIILVLGAFGMASTLQTWYQRIYEQPPQRSTLRRWAYQGVGVAAFCLYIAAQLAILEEVKPAAGPALALVVTFVSASLFWWCAAYFLLFCKVPWRRLLPAGLATGFCVTGLDLVSKLVFSGELVAGHKAYGSAGVVMSLITYLVGQGVCLHLGAVVGRMWNDRQEARAESLLTAPAD